MPLTFIQPSLPAIDQGRAEAAGGLISAEQWSGKLAAGDPEA